MVCYYYFIICLGTRCKWHRSNVLSFLSLVMFWWLSSPECIIDIKLTRLCFFLFLQLCIVASLCIFLFYLLLQFFCLLCCILFCVWCRSLAWCIFVLFWSLICEGVSLVCWLFDSIVHLPFYNIATIRCVFISKLYFDVFIFIIIIIIFKWCWWIYVFKSDV